MSKMPLKCPENGPKVLATDDQVLTLMGVLLPSSFTHVWFRMLNGKSKFHHALRSDTKIFLLQLENVLKDFLKLAVFLIGEDHAPRELGMFEILTHH